MSRQTIYSRSALPVRSKGFRMAIAAIAALSLTACQQFETPSDVLFAPTFSKSRQNLPNTYHTAYDCRTFTGSGWKGIVGGKVKNFDQTYSVSQAGCFKSEAECQAYLTVWRSYIDIPRFMRCLPHTA